MKSKRGRSFKPGQAFHDKEKKHKKEFAETTVQSSKHLGNSLVVDPDFFVEEWPDLTVRQRKFLAIYSEIGQISYSFRLMGYASAHIHYKWMKEPQYKEAFEAARIQAINTLEEEAWRRAVRGIKRFRFFKGEPIADPRTGKPYYEMEYSDSLLTMLLKASAPEKYKDRTEQQIKGEISNKMEARVSVAALLAKVPVELRKQLLEHLQEGDQEED
jgi:hypothetical protein